MQVPRILLAALIFSASVCARGAEGERDIVIGDFDSSDYGKWIATGDAFGSGPAEGTLPQQNQVSGFRGRYVSSYHGTDQSQGTLTSPAFKIERDAIAFRIGGGDHEGSTCLNLIVDGKVVRTLSGGNDEQLLPATWDTRDLRGKQAQLQIVDRETGRWGHITVDDIVQTNNPAVPPIVLAPLYHETYRPQFHFTSDKNWINDPNGCVYYKGEYHLFFQHNPFGNEWGHMTWGHAVSPDLLHWTQRPHALLPDAMGTMFSGSAVVDTNNTSGFGTNGKPTLVAMYTAAGNTSPESKGKAFTQCLAYSNDDGRTWTKYEHNPVIEHIAAENRDPKVIWHEPTRTWICSLYLEGNQFANFNSPDLKVWTKLQQLSLDGSGECPDFFPLAVDGDPKNIKWVFTGADAGYLVGDFDGKTFTGAGKPLHVDFGGNYYASQTFSDTPDGRRIQIGWMRGGKYPRMPFNGQMSFPATLELRSTADGPRLFRNPIKEIESLHDAAFERKSIELQPGQNPLADIKGDLFHIKLVMRPGAASVVGLNIRGQQIRYNVAQKKLTALGETNVELVDGKLTLEVLVDRTTIETFANGGARAFSSCFLPDDAAGSPLGLVSEGGAAKIESLQVWTLKSTWPKP